MLSLFTKEHRDDFLAEIERILPDGDYHYLAGPMSNRPGFNFAEFDRVAGLLREQGYAIASPAEFDHEEVRAEIMASPDGANHDEVGSLWADCLSRDLCVIAHPRCVGLILLDDWHKSRGALLETDVAYRLGKPMFEYHDTNPRLVDIDRTKRLQEYDDIEDARKRIEEYMDSGKLAGLVPTGKQLLEEKEGHPLDLDPLGATRQARMLDRVGVGLSVPPGRRAV